MTSHTECKQCLSSLLFIYLFVSLLKGIWVCYVFFLHKNSCLLYLWMAHLKTHGHNLHSNCQIESCSAQCTCPSLCVCEGGGGGLMVRGHVSVLFCMCCLFFPRMYHIIWKQRGKRAVEGGVEAEMEEQDKWVWLLEKYTLYKKR